jgi:hypothetical protein
MASSPKDRGDSPAPKVLALVVANLVVQDPNSHNFHILGTYNTIRASAFPSACGSFAVYLALTDGHGECPPKPRLVDVDEARPALIEGSFRVAFPDPNATPEQVFVAQHVVFPEPGDYRLQVLYQNELLSERRIPVRRS